MRFSFPGIEHVFDTEEGLVNTIVIENGHLFISILNDLQQQYEGNEGIGVMSQNGKELAIDKNSELLTQFVPFDINAKSLITKLLSVFEKTAVNETFYMKTMELMSNVERYLFELSMETTGDVEFTKLSIGSILKATGIQFRDDYDSLAEKIIDYIELVYTYDRKKLFFTVNLRSFLSDNEMELFMQCVLQHGFHVIALENKEYRKLPLERRYIIDEDLCQIC